MTTTGETETAVRWLEAAQVAPPFQVPAKLVDWEKQRAEVRATLWRLLGRLPPRPASPVVRTIASETRPYGRVEKFEFDNGAGATVPGWLVLPAGVQGPSPAILYCHWHGGEYDKGAIELFRQEHTPEVPAETLARKGYVVLAIDAYGFGERSGHGPGGPEERGGAEELSASKFHLWVGRTLWGMIVRDDLMALDYLATRPEVDARRIGVTGISMGATRSWWLMALDERPRAGVAVACLTRYTDLIRHGGLRYHGIYYYVPGMLNHFDTEAVVALSAPRALLCLTGDSDAGSPVAGIRRIEQTVELAYRLHGAETDFSSVIYPGVGHVYTPDMWQKMLGWFDRHLRP